MIGVIADDLTGAAELGAVGLRHGLSAEVVLSGEPTPGIDLVCIDTDSRSSPGVEAARCAARAARLLQTAEVNWIYKKTDSVLRGNVATEIEAIVGQLGLDGALLVPANPSLGRTIVDGEYFVHGKLIHQTEFARDPKHPRLSPQVLELVDRPSALPVCVRNLNEALPHGGIVIGAVASPEDVRAWARVDVERWLRAGGAEFFAALLKPGTPPPIPTEPKGPQLFVCGSNSEATKNFVGQQRHQGVPALSLPEKGATGGLNPRDIEQLASEVVSALRDNARVVLHIGLPPVTTVSIAEQLAVDLTRVAAGVLRRAPVRQVYAEGGATAVLMAREMSWGRLKVMAELAPGVVSLTPKGDPHTFTIKPGSYSWPLAVLRA